MECPNAWLEPVIPVQSLAQEGSPVIPRRYRRPSCERPPTDALSEEKAVGIPVVDLRGLASGLPAERAATLRTISEACRGWGFFQVEHHGVSLDLVARLRAAWRAFFHLPADAKKPYANTPATYEGYGSRLGVEKGAILDWGDYFFLHFLPRHLRDYDKWPAVPPTCRETTEEYGTALVRLCGTLMGALSASLGLDADRLPSAFAGEGAVGATLRVNFYPRCPQPEMTLGLSPHSDPGGLTVLLPDDTVKGLQVRRDGDWVTVRPRPGAFVVNVGDQIQVLSNGVYKSVEHRVVVNAAEERFSFAWFYNPEGDRRLEPLPELVTPDRPPLYQPMTYNEYRRFIRLKGPRGKQQVESLKKTDLNQLQYSIHQAPGCPAQPDDLSYTHTHTHPIAS